MGPVEARGFVELVEPRATRGVRMTLRLVSLGDMPKETMPRRARIRTLGPAPALRPGDAVRVRATLAPPGAPVIPGGYDFARAAWFQGLGAVGYTMRAPGARPKSRGGSRGVDVEGRRRGIAAVDRRARQGGAAGRNGRHCHGAHHRRARRHFRSDQRCVPRFRLAAHSLDFRFAHGGDGGRGVLSGAAAVGVCAGFGAQLSDQEMGRRRGCDRGAGLSADFGRGVCNGALLHHDLDCVSRHPARPAGARHAQHRHRSPADSGAVSREPAGCGLPDVVRGGGGAGGGLRVAGAAARSEARGARADGWRGR